MKNINIISNGIYKVNSAMSAIQQKHAVHFLRGLIGDAKASIKRISMAFCEKSHSNLTKFFTKDWWCEEDFNKKRIFEFINKDEIYALIIDDSNAVKFGIKMEAVSKFKCHENIGFETAHCIVISGVVDKKGEFLPLFSTIYITEEEAEYLGVEFKTKHQIAREHTTRAKELGIKFYANIYDSWYFNDDMISFSEKKEHIVSQLSGKYTITINNETKKVSKFKQTINRRKLKVFYSGGKRVRYLEYITTLSTGKMIKIIAFISKGDTMKFLVSTNTDWSSKRIFHEYSKRQKIEVYIRDCKQELHFKDCHFRHLNAHDKWHVLIMFAYSILRHFINSKEAVKRKIDTLGKAIDFFRCLPGFYPRLT